MYATPEMNIGGELQSEINLSNADLQNALSGGNQFLQSTRLLFYDQMIQIF